MKNKNYQYIGEFLEDASFIAWVHGTDSDDIQFWENWKTEHPEQLEMMEAARAIVKGIRVEPKFLGKEEVNEEWEKLTQIIDTREQKNPSLILPQKSWFGRRSTYLIAAAVAFLFAMGLLLTQLTKSEVVSYYTDFGKRQEIELPDGTRLTLNANSTLRFEKERPRKVWLDGEAFFKVARKVESKKKFEVITPDLTVEVYGTEFNVNSRKKQTQVVLEEGKVKLSLSNGALKEMKPGDLITYSADQQKIIEEKELKQVNTLTSWKDGTLIFDDISLKDAMSRIADLYGLEVVFENAEIADENIYLAVPTDNIEICIRAIERLGSIQISLEDKILKISR